MFFRGSRYEPISTATLLQRGKPEIRYKRVRFIVRDPAQAGYLVKQGDRIDTIAWAVFGDPEMWWRIADANADLSPQDLTTTPGRTLGVSLPIR